MIARNSFVIMVTQATNAALGMLALFAISKLWGGSAPGIMGVVWFGFSFVGAFSFITNMGFDAAHVKKISEGRDLGKCNGTYIAIKLILTALLVVSVISTVLIWKHVLNHDTFYDSTRESVVYIFTGYYVFFSLAQIPVMTFNSQKKNVKSQLSLLMEPIVRLSLFLVVGLAGVSGALIVTDSGTQVIDIPTRWVWPEALQGLQTYLAAHTIGAMSLAYMFSAMGMLIVGFLMFRKYPISRPDREYLGIYLRFAIPMMIPVIFSLMCSYLDKVILGYYWTSLEVGYYFAVQRISTFVMLIPSAIGVVLFPTISSLHEKYRKDLVKGRRKLITMTKTAERYISMVTVPMVAVIMVFAVPLIDIILNSSFRPGAVSMQILTAYTYVATLYVPCFFLILGTDRPEIIAKTYLAFGVSNIVLNLMLIPRDGVLSDFGISGPTGAALSVLISAIIMFAILHHYSGRLMKRGLFEKRVLLHLAAGIAVGLLMWKLGGLFDTVRWYHIGIMSLIGIGTYLGILFGMGEFRRKDLDFFLGTVNPVSIARYVHDEMRHKK